MNNWEGVNKRVEGMNKKGRVNKKKKERMNKIVGGANKKGKVNKRVGGVKYKGKRR